VQKHQVTRFGTYRALVSGRECTVIIESDYRGRGRGWRATNTRTGRDVIIKSAQRLRSPVNELAREYAAAHPPKASRPRPASSTRPASAPRLASGDVVDDILRATLTAESIRCHVQRAIWCRACGNILDCTRAVEIDLVDAGRDECLRSYIVCAACYDARLAPQLSEIRERAGDKVRIDVNDGRAYAAEGLL